MRIGVVSLFYPSDRNPFFGTYVKEELDGLTEQVEIRLIAPFFNQFWLGEKHSFTSSCGYPVLRPFSMGFPRWFFQALFPKSLSLSLSMVGKFFSGCDVVHAHNAFPEAVASVKAFKRKFPLVVTVHGTDVNICAKNISLRPAIVRALNSTSRIISVSRDLKNTLRDIGVTAEIEIIPNGINTSLFTPGDKREACEKLGLNPDLPRIIFIGNFIPVKGIKYLIGALPEVQHFHPACELVLIGAGPGGKDSAAYRKQIEDLGMERHVIILEKVPNGELPGWIRASDVFVLPSIKEGFGIVAVEALACGRPVVATRSGGPEEIVKEGLGFLVPPGDSHALGDAIVKVLFRKDILDPAQLAETARKRFSLPMITKRIVKVYEDVCREGRLR
jgi:teichuronic acid biosynthesis glycosyltransferase TuaC